MKTLFYCKKVVKSRLAFYMSSDRGQIYLFTEDYYGSLYTYFEKGVTIDTTKKYDESTQIGKVCTKMKSYIMDDSNLKKIYKMRADRSSPKPKKRLFQKNSYTVSSYALPLIDA